MNWGNSSQKQKIEDAERQDWDKSSNSPVWLRQIFKVLSRLNEA
jgi:hypothetical protein